MPSQPRTTKSWYDWILNFLMSGVETTTCGLPPRLTSFASRSPNVQHTLSLPGNTHTGPIMISGGIYLPCSSTPVAIVAVLWLNELTNIFVHRSLVFITSHVSQQVCDRWTEVPHLIQHLHSRQLTSHQH